MPRLNRSTNKLSADVVGKDLADRVSALESLARGPLLEEIGEDGHRSETETPHHDSEVALESRGEKPVRPGLRRRLIASITSLVMVVGITGMAWAAQGAQPDDWIYGLTQVLDALGIGFGTVPDELTALESSNESNPGAVESQGNNPSESKGLQRAIEVIGSEKPSDEVSNSIKDEVAELLNYLHESGRLNAPDIAAVAKDIAADRRPDDAGKPEDTGKPANPGQP